MVYNSSGQTILYQSTEFFFGTGILFLILGALYKCQRIISTLPSTPELLIEIVKKYKVTQVSFSPYFIAKLVQIKNLEPFESIKMWMILGATATTDLCEKLKKFLPNGVIINCFGSTECEFITSNYCGVKFGTSGKVFFDNQIKIINDNGNSLDINQKGEICVKKKNIFNGYYNDFEKTKEVFDGEWFKTGDIGYFDDEEYLHVVGRKKELLKFNNYHVNPTELESIINEIDGVVSSCVVGVPETITGNDIVHAFVIVDESKNLSETQIENFVNSKVIEAKKIRGGVHFVESFPLTASGKVKKSELKKLACEKFTK